MRRKMKAMIMDMCILSHKTQCFLMFGHVRTCRRRRRGQTEGFDRNFTMGITNPIGVSEVIGVITNHPVVMDDRDLVLVLKVTTGDPPKKLPIERFRWY